jgi:hypothetical protein
MDADSLETCGLSEEARFAAFRAMICREKGEDFRNGVHLSSLMRRLQGLGVLFGASAAVLTALPFGAIPVLSVLDGKAVVGIVAAAAAACFLAIQQLKLPARANAHFRKSELLHQLLVELCLCSEYPKSHPELQKFARRYGEILRMTSRDFNAINASYGSLDPRPDAAVQPPV